MKKKLKKELLARLYHAHHEARKGKRKTKNERAFEIYGLENLIWLRDCILLKEYNPMRGICFVLYVPVIREVFAASYRDRVIHHFIYDVVAEWWDKQFIYDSYSCRKGKGTLFGIKRLEHHIRSVSDNYMKIAYVIKLDIKGYFTSMSREKLYELAIRGLNRQFPKGERGELYYIVKYLWRQVIFDDPVTGVTRKGTEDEWGLLKEGKSLFYQDPGLGIVIGNLTSQLLSNILLNELDRFVTMKLGYKHYGRYVDDFYIVVPAEQKEQALRDVAVIEKFLWRELGLKLHPKKRYCQEIHKGVEFIGARIYPGFKLVSKRIERNFRRAVKEFAEGEVKAETIISYLGLLGHFKSYKLRKSAFEAVGFDYSRIMRAWREGGNETKRVLREERSKKLGL